MAPDAQRGVCAPHGRVRAVLRPVAVLLGLVLAGVVGGLGVQARVHHIVYMC